MHRHGVGRKRIDDQEIVAFRLLLGERETRVAQHDVGLRLAIRQEREILGLGDLDHHGIDLEEAPLSRPEPEWQASEPAPRPMTPNLGSTRMAAAMEPVSRTAEAMGPWTW